jgi:hypothetical protein
VWNRARGRELKKRASYVNRSRESQPGGKEKPAENLTAGPLGQAINPRWRYATLEEEVGGSGNAKSRRSGSKVQAGLWENDKEESG